VRNNIPDQRQAECARIIGRVPSLAVAALTNGLR